VRPIKSHGEKSQIPNAKSQRKLKAEDGSEKPVAFETSRLNFFWRLNIAVWDFDGSG
jgi:hypothetical protein